MRRALPCLLLLIACGGPSSPGGSGGAGGIEGTGGAGGAGGTGGTPCGDADGDGYLDRSCGGDDCDDADPLAHPGAQELCKDGVDQNCDGTADEGCACSVGEMQACWTGDPLNRGRGMCRDGYQRCDAHGTWGPCTGEVDPTEEPAACDGLDQDCDGADVAACNGCLPQEICGNGVDDDCNQVIDDPSFCSTSCLPSIAPASGTLECCSDDSRFGYLCIEAAGLAECASTDRTCFDLDGDAGTRCVKRCSADGTCVCGRPADPVPDEVPDCGFETPCNRLGCEEHKSANCYLGPPGTLGVGLCHAGQTTCVDAAWGSCEGQVLPGEERCGNGVDDDCDGLLDEDDGTGHSCPRTDCASEELCDNGFDDDCDGFVDEGCPAADDQQACYSGAATSRDRGTCKSGIQTRQPDGHWGPCVGEVLPAPERCGDDLDTNCNGMGGAHAPEEPGCCKSSGEEVCNGQDDDCDGLADEGLLSSCGTCESSCPDSLHVDPVNDCSATGRTCSRMKAVKSGGVEVDVAAALPGGDDHGLYFLTELGVRRFNTRTESTDWDFPTHPLSGYVSLGASIDGSVWLSYGTQLTHLDGSGKKLCDYLPRNTNDFLFAPTVDESGVAWVLGNDQNDHSFYLLSFAPKSFQQGACIPAGDALDLGGAQLNQVVAGPAPWLWITGSPTGLRIDRGTLATASISMDSTYSSHPVVDDSGDLWAASRTQRALFHIPAGDDGTHATLFPTPIYQFVGAEDGLLWGTAYPAQALAYMDPTSGLTTTEDSPPGTSYIGNVSIDDQDVLWMMGSTDPATAPHLMRFDSVKGTWRDFLDQIGMEDNEAGNYTTAAQQIRLGRRLGGWTQDLDGGSNEVVWTSGSWSADVPDGSSLQVSFRVADRVENLDLQRPCGPFSSSPADLSTCEGGAPRGRFLRATADFRTGATSGPVLRDVTLAFGRP